MSEQQKQHSPKAKSSYRVKVRNSLVDLVDLPEPHIWDHLTSEEELLFSSNNVIQSWLMVRYRRPGIFGFYRESAALITRCVLISSRSFLIIYAKEKKHQGYALKLNKADFVQISRPNLQGNHSVTIKWNFGELVLSLRSDQLSLWYSRILQGLSSSSQNSNTNSPWFKNGNASKMMEVATQTDEEPLCSTPKTTFTADVASVTPEDKQQDPSEECNQSTICNTLREVSDSCLSKNKGILQPNATTLMSEQPNAVSPPTNLNSQTDLITAISKLKNRNSGKFQCDVEPPAFIVVKQYGFGFSTEEVCVDESPEAMSVFYALIISYPLRKWIADYVLRERFEGWDQELIDIAFYTARTLLLLMLHRAAPHLLVMDVLTLSYPFRRLCEIVLQNKPMFSWKMELNALANCTMIFFLIEILFRKTFGELLQLEVLESAWWLIYFVCTSMALQLFPPLPLRARRHEH